MSHVQESQPRHQKTMRLLSILEGRHEEKHFRHEETQERCDGIFVKGVGRIKSGKNATSNLEGSVDSVKVNEERPRGRVAEKSKTEREGGRTKKSEKKKREVGEAGGRTKKSEKERKARERVEKSEKER